jgi:hypothetical protein
VSPPYSQELHEMHYLGKGAWVQPPDPPAAGRETLVDDNAIEVVQLGAGVLAGIVLAGAAAAGASRYRHNHAHPRAA